MFKHPVPRIFYTRAASCVFVHPDHPVLPHPVHPVQNIILYTRSLQNRMCKKTLVCTPGPYKIACVNMSVGYVSTPGPFSQNTLGRECGMYTYYYTRTFTKMHKELSVVCTLITPGHSQKCTKKILTFPFFFPCRGLRVVWRNVEVRSVVFRTTPGPLQNKVHKNGMTLHPGLFRVANV
jgi:hypothetical protein